MTRENFTMNFCCAATDRRFSATFERSNETGIFRITHIAKSEPALNMGSDTKHNENPLSEVPADKVSLQNFLCPHCEPNGQKKNRSRFFRCPNCREYICGGKSGRFGYQCRKSCGAKGKWNKGGSGIQSFTGGLTQKQAAIAHTSAPQLNAPSAPPPSLALPKPPGTSLVVTK